MFTKSFFSQFGVSPLVGFFPPSSHLQLTEIIYYSQTRNGSLVTTGQFHTPELVIKGLSKSASQLAFQILFPLTSISSLLT